MTITDIATASGFTAPPAPQHPLSSLTAAEIEAVRAVVLGLRTTTDATRFAYVGLEEAHEGRGPGVGVRHRSAARAARTRAAARHAVGTVARPVVSLADRRRALGRRAGRHRQASCRSSTPSSKRSGVIANENEEWVAALAARGLTPDDVVLVPLSAGTTATRTRRVAASCARSPSGRIHAADHPWAHPVDGLTAYIDVAARSVIKIVDTPGFDIPQTSGNYDDPALQGPPLEGLKPIVITQPEGSSLTVDGEHVTWGEWDLRIGFDTREGLILRQLSFAGDARSCTAGRSARWSCPTPTRSRTGSGRTTSTPASTSSAGTPTSSSWAATAWATSRTSTRSSRTSSGCRAPCATACACTRRTSARSGSTPTSSPARRRCDGRGGW